MESDRFIRLPNALLDALLRVPLTGTQWSILFWVIRRTLGWNRQTTPFSWYKIAKELRLDRGGIVRSARRMLDSEILEIQNGEVGIQQDQAAWQRLKPTAQGKKEMTDVSADKSHRKAMTRVSASDDGSHPKRCLESSVFRRAKDSSKDKLKTYIKTRRRKARFPNESHTTSDITRPNLARAKPISGEKYERLSQN